jgi:ATPase subunit of ABC transporter with duplicated ATPase domains
MTRIRSILIASLALAVAAPVAATADPGKGKGQTKSAEVKPEKAKQAPKGKQAEFKGLVKAVDAAAGTVTVTVQKASKHGRAHTGKDVVFTLSGVKKIKVADTNADGKKDLSDVKVGDRAKAGARIAKDADVAAPVAANKFRAKAPEATEEPAPAPAPAP